MRLQFRITHTAHSKWAIAGTYSVSTNSIEVYFLAYYWNSGINDHKKEDAELWSILVEFPFALFYAVPYIEQ